jgi:4a-hydroxytetrahydrobiopterin dehydratase
MKKETGNLTKKQCTPCEGGVPPLRGKDIEPWLKQISQEWQVVEEKKLRREFKFGDFKETMKFANEVAELAEQEGHHPVLHITYGKLVIELWTHKIDGLWDNDFILAAKIDELETM